MAGLAFVLLVMIVRHTATTVRELENAMILTHRSWRINSSSKGQAAKVAGREKESERTQTWGSACIRVEGDICKVLKVYSLLVNLKHKGRIRESKKIAESFKCLLSRLSRAF